ncbi:MAG: tRNA uridine-5-carboxymethylaminomethyl(34) synthesis GTPase MnmE [Termitinemataceae bacterium]
MNRPSYGDDDPIAAHATALAESALALIRTSGPGSIELVAQRFSRPQALLAAPGNTIVHGWILTETGEKVDEVLLSVFRAPRSYTGEDGIDISCHGGITSARAIMENLLTSGFRQALPGEFTFRAFMNGKMDLTRSESVVEIIEAKTDESRKHAIDRLSGALEQEIRALRDNLVSALAATELFLDYSEDDGVSLIADMSSPELAEAQGILPDRDRIEATIEKLKALSASYRIEKLYRDGALVAIAGCPNAGKSSLFNRLLKEERSIVTDIPGTTRDYIEAWISIEGIPVRLIDTAGLRDTQDPIEQIGVQRSRSIIQGADLVMYLIDGKTGFTAADRELLAEYEDPALWEGREAPPVLLVWNKADIQNPPAIEQLEGERLSTKVSQDLIAVSATTGQGIPELARHIRTTLEGSASAPSGLVGIATERQKHLIDAAIASLSEALDLADQHEPLDIIAPAIREAAEALGEITGDVSRADVLEIMFSRFCVGK